MVPYRVNNLRHMDLVCFVFEKKNGFFFANFLKQETEGKKSENF